jgi:hypothetical protein
MPCVSWRGYLARSPKIKAVNQTHSTGPAAGMYAIRSKTIKKASGHDASHSNSAPTAGIRLRLSSLRFIRVILLIGAVLHLGGGHWGVLQAVAWMKMLVEYSQAEGIRTGFSKTFDGEHPCEMCKSISKGRESEKQTPFAPLRMDGLKLKDLLPTDEIRIHRRDLALATPTAFWPAQVLPAQWTPSPEAPPPRTLLS